MERGLRALLDPATGSGSAPFLTDARGGGALDRRGIAAAAVAWSRELDARAVPPGARVLLDVEDPLAFAAVHLAVVAAGRASAPVDPSAPPAAAERARRALAPALVVTDRAERAGVTVRPGSGLPVHPSAGGRDRDRGPGSVVLLTSGSTGAPKSVELSEAQLLHVARAVARHHRLSPGDRGFCPLPLFHVNAQVVGVLATLVSGGELVLDRRFRRTGFWSLLRSHDATWLNAAPAIVTILSREPDDPDVPPRLRFVRSASAPLLPAVRRRFQERTGLAVVESYGMTEAASQITATPLDEPHRPGSVGRPVDVELRVVDGRVRVRGAGVITAYAGGAAAERVNAERFDADGWLDTGDLGRLDEDGWLYLTGRADDVVNRGGELVHPREVEEVLLAEVDVAEAVVVGRPDDVLGAVPVACVRPGADAAPDLAERLRRRCAQELAPFKRPAEILLVERFPVGPTGKVRRAQVRAELREEPRAELATG